MDQVVVGNSIGGPMYEMGSTGSNGMVHSHPEMIGSSSSSVKFASAHNHGSRSIDGVHQQQQQQQQQQHSHNAHFHAGHNHVVPPAAAVGNVSSTSHHHHAGILHQQRQLQHDPNQPAPTPVAHYHHLGYGGGEQTPTNNGANAVHDLFNIQQQQQQQQQHHQQQQQQQQQSIHVNGHATPQYHLKHNHIPAKDGKLPSECKVPKKSSLKKRSAASIRFESSLLGNSRSSQSLTNLAATSGTGFTLNTAHNHLNSMGAAGLTPSSTSNTRKRPHGGGCSKPVEIVHFHLKGGPPWGFRIKQREENVFISKVCIFVLYCSYIL